jgi:transcriptional regulator with XRE-family HTH domain
MLICDRLRELRESKNLSQGDIEKRTGLLRSYISRVENGHTVPAVESLEKFARALEVPLYQLFYDGDKPPQLPNLLKRKTSDDIVWWNSGKDAAYLHELRKYLGKTKDSDRKILAGASDNGVLISRKPGKPGTDGTVPDLSLQDII